MFLTNRFYAIAVATIILLASGNYFPPLYAVGRMLMWLLFIATAADIVLLYYRRHISAYRQIADRLSNGDDNQIRLRVESNCPFGLRLNIIDEIPFVFQRRDISFRLRLAAREAKTVVYSLRPTRREIGRAHV